MLLEAATAETCSACFHQMSELLPVKHVAHVHQCLRLCLQHSLCALPISTNVSTKVCVFGLSLPMSVCSACLYQCLCVLLVSISVCVFCLSLPMSVCSACLCQCLHYCLCALPVSTNICVSCLSLPMSPPIFVCSACLHQYLLKAATSKHSLPVSTNVCSK